MSKVQTRFFGEMEFPPDSVFRFPAGIPGFEDEREFGFIHDPTSDPLLFLQSISTGELCFASLPVLRADPTYKVTFTEEDLAVLEFPPNSHPRIGDDFLCVSLVSTEVGETPKVNLMSPIVVNLVNRLGLQITPAVSVYSSRHPMRVTRAATCS